MTALIVLAAGLSKRFGAEDKLLADLNGKPILQHVIDTAKPIAFSHRFAVISDDMRLKNICKSNSYDIILNEYPERGQGRSIALGVSRALELGANSACILLGDMPFITAEHLEKLLAAKSESDRIFSLNQNIAMPPAIFSGEALRQLMTISSETGAKSALSTAPSFEIALPDGQAQDIDTQEMLRNWNAL